MTKFIKVIFNGEVIGAERIEEPEFIMYQEKYNSLIVCSENEAQGISSENKKHIYQLENKTPIVSDEVKFIASFIDETEYESLKANLKDPPEEEPEVIGEPEPDGNNYMTAAEMRAKIIELTEMMTALQTENEFLSDCLIEMSEVVYGE